MHLNSSSLTFDIIDVLGVVTSVGEVSTIRTRKDQKDLAKRDFTLADQTKREVACTMWGDVATNFEGKVGPSPPVFRSCFFNVRIRLPRCRAESATLVLCYHVLIGDAIALKNVRVSEYRDAKQITTIQNTQIMINPTVPEATELKSWSSSSLSAQMKCRKRGLLSLPPSQSSLLCTGMRTIRKACPTKYTRSRLLKRRERALASFRRSSP